MTGPREKDQRPRRSASRPGVVGLASILESVDEMGRSLERRDQPVNFLGTKRTHGSKEKLFEERIEVILELRLAVVQH